MEVTVAIEDDAPQLLKLQKSAYVSEAELHNDFNIPPLTQTLESLKASFSNKTILKIVVANEIVASGQAELIGNTCHIGRMAVWPHRRGQGYGSKLLSSLENVFPSDKRIELFTGINSQSNLAMYSNKGYSQFKLDKLGGTTIVYLEKFKNGS